MSLWHYTLRRGTKFWPPCSFTCWWKFHQHCWFNNSTHCPVCSSIYLCSSDGLETHSHSAHVTEDLHSRSVLLALFCSLSCSFQFSTCRGFTHALHLIHSTLVVLAYLSQWSNLRTSIYPMYLVTFVVDDHSIPDRLLNVRNALQITLFTPNGTPMKTFCALHVCNIEPS